jgi:type II secretory pathway pseudopilin PulG
MLGMSTLASISSQAFSIVETLVVIAVLAVLTVVAVPAFNRARDSADNAKCVSQLRTIGSLFYLHSNEHNGRTPSMNEGAGNNVLTWRYYLMETYTGQLATGAGTAERRKAETMKTAYPFWCPAYLRKFKKEDHPGGRGSYALNQYFRQQRNLMALTSLGYGKLEPLVADGMPRANNPEQGALPPLNSLQSGNRQGGVGDYHAGGYINVLYLNGSVGRLSPEQQQELSPLVENKDDFQ